MGTAKLGVIFGRLKYLELGKKFLGGVGEKVGDRKNLRHIQKKGRQNFLGIKNI